MKSFTLKAILKTSGLFALSMYLLFVLNPTCVSAATIHLVPDFKTVSVGDTVIVTVEMDTLDKQPNVVEGNILVKDGMEKVEISKLSVAGSALSVWSQSPSWDNNSLISFTGGAPGGFSQKSAILFKIVFLAKEEGKVTLSPKDIKAYDNDGKGTLVDVSGDSVTIDIESKKIGQQKNQWEDILANDQQPPENVTAVFGQDSNLFEGKKIMYLSASDALSGVDYYEVKEGDRPAVRSGEIYVLLDQSESSKILITAYDFAGNHHQILLQPKNQKISYWRLIAGLLIFAGLLYAFMKSLKLKTKKNAESK